MGDHRAAIIGIYEAFGRGDVAGLLRHVSPEVAWEYHGSAAVPWLQPGTGHDAVIAFLTAFGTAAQVEHFAPKQLFADGNTVVALVDITFTVRATGKRVVEVDEAHVWHCNDDGLVVKFRHAADTYQHWRATQAD